MIDIGCQCYRLYNPIFAAKQNLEHIRIKPFYIEAFDSEKATRPI